MYDPYDLQTAFAEISVLGLLFNRREVVVRTELRLLLALAVLLAAAPMLSACNTVAGAGQDISAAGRGISHTADKVAGDR